MLHKLGYDYVCENCEQPCRERDMGSYHDTICKTCEAALPPEDITAARLRWEDTGVMA